MIFWDMNTVFDGNNVSRAKGHEKIKLIVGGGSVVLNSVLIILING